MSDTFVGTPTIDLLVRVDHAWAAQSARRRSLVLAGVSSGLAMAVAATSVVSVLVSTVLAFVAVTAGAAAVVDVHEHRIPNRLLSLSTVAIVLAALIDAPSLGVIAFGAATASVPLWVVRYGRGLGIGDVKFAAVLGAAGALVHPSVGIGVVWFAAVFSVVVAYCSGTSRLAMGPWLWAGYLASTSIGVLLVQVGGQPWPAPF